MKNPKINYALVGGFVILVIAGLVVTVALLTGRTGATDDYYSVYDNVSGVSYGTRVLYEGYPIGQVETVVPVEEDGHLHFHVAFSVTRGWKIPKDTVAEIAAPGVLAAVILSLRGGKSTDILKPGDQVQGVGATNLMASVNDLASDIRDLTDTQIKPIIAKVSEVLTGVGTMMGTDGAGATSDLRRMVDTVSQATPQIVNNITTFSNRLNQSADRLDLLLSDKNLHTIEDIVENLNNATHNMNDLTTRLDQTRATIDGMVGNADKMVTDVKSMVSDNRTDVERTVTELRQSVETVARHIDAISENMESASRNMSEFSRQIRENPGLLLGSKPPADNAR